MLHDNNVVHANKGVYKMKNKYLLLNFMIMISAILIITGLIMKIIECENEIKKQEIEINRLLDENESLWNNYYMNVTNKDEYKYYE